MRFRSETRAAISEDSQYDVAIACLGYEARATKVSQNFLSDSKRRFAIGFDRQQEHDYEKNLDYFRRSGFEVFVGVDDEAFEITIQSILKDCIDLNGGTKLKIAIDISCFDRFRLAVLVQNLYERMTDREIVEITFIYNIAAYAEPDKDFLANIRLQPVHPAYVGSRPDPLSRTVAIIGLGYEQEKAVGAAEYLEASEVFAFHPRSEVTEYFSSVAKANGLLLSQLDQAHKIIYDVEDCASLVADLSSLIRGLIGKSAVILIPLGPKMFALACMLAACIERRASVWRMSQGSVGTPLNRYPSESFSIIKAKL